MMRAGLSTTRAIGLALAILLALFAITYIPALTLWLPHTMGLAR